MFIITLTYTKPIEDVEKALNAHIEYLNKYYELNTFICSGRKVPRTGGVILCRAESIEHVWSIIKQDPFYQQDVANYEVIEFAPTKCAQMLEDYLKS